MSLFEMIKQDFLLRSGRSVQHSHGHILYCSAFFFFFMWMSRKPREALMLQGRFVTVSVDSCQQRPLRRPFRFTDSDKVNLQRAHCRATLTCTYLKKLLIKIPNRGREHHSGTYAEKMYSHSEAKCLSLYECLTFALRCSDKRLELFSLLF